MSTDLSVQRGGNLALPDYMRQETDTGLEQLSRYIVPPRIKVVQKSAQEPFLSLFRTGDVVLVPQMTLLAPINVNERQQPGKDGVPFFFAPLFFFVEWVTLNPIALRGSLPMVRHRTIDESDRIVKLSRDPQLWEEDHPDGLKDSKGNAYKVRHCEFLNYVVELVNNPDLEGLPLVMSFAKGEHRAGSSFNALARLRKAPLYGCQFQGQCRWRPGTGKGDWYGIDVTNPAADSEVPPFAPDQDTYERRRAEYQRLKEAHAANLITVDHESDEVEVEVPIEKQRF